MGARTSPEMLQARELLRAGSTAVQAAKQTGLNRSSIHRDKICQEIIAARKPKETAAP